MNRPGKIQLVGSNVQRLLSPLALLLCWQGLGMAGLLPNYLPPPLLVARQFVRMLLAGELIPHLLASLSRSYSGLALGSLLGILAGLLAGISRHLERLFNPVISLTYPIPKIAFLPLLMVWFGIGNLSKMIIILLVCFYPTFISAYNGAKGVEPILIWSARNMGASPLQLFGKVVIPSALPQIFAGLRVATAISFILLFAAEMIGSTSGLGFLIIFAEANLRYDIMFVSILAIATMGYLSDRLLITLHRRLLHWQQGGAGT